MFLWCWSAWACQTASNAKSWGTTFSCSRRRPDSGPKRNPIHRGTGRSLARVSCDLTDWRTHWWCCGLFRLLKTSETGHIEIVLASPFPIHPFVFGFRVLCCRPCTVFQRHPDSASTYPYIFWLCIVPTWDWPAPTLSCASIFRLGKTSTFILVTLPICW